MVDLCAGAAPCCHGILSVFKAEHDPDWRGFLELRFYRSAGRRTSWQSHTGKPEALDIPADTKVTISFPGKFEGKTVELAPRNMDQNEDEDGVPNMREGGLTNYFIFPGESGQDPQWLMGLEWHSLAVVNFELPDGKKYMC